MIWRLLALAEQLDDGLLRQVFTHSSWVAERGRSYERLEFLGDSVLSLAVTTELYRRFPDHSEGSLARLRAYIVSRATCAKVATRLGLPEFVRRFGAGHETVELDQLVSNENILADMTESLIGAVYLTYGLDVVRPAVIEAFTEHISFAERSYVDFKTELQEQLAKNGRSVAYQLVETVGPPHSREFVLEAVVDGVALGRGVGASKKRAEQDAAAEALRELSGAERPKRRRARGRRRGAGADADAQTGDDGAQVGDDAALDAADLPGEGDATGDEAVSYIESEPVAPEAPEPPADADSHDAVVPSAVTADVPPSPEPEGAPVAGFDAAPPEPEEAPVAGLAVMPPGPESAAQVEPEVPAPAADVAPVVAPDEPAPALDAAPVGDADVSGQVPWGASVAGHEPPAPMPESAPAVEPDVPAPVSDAPAVEPDVPAPLPESGASADAGVPAPAVAAPASDPQSQPAHAGVEPRVEPPLAETPPTKTDVEPPVEPPLAAEPAPRVVFDMGAATPGHTVLRSYSVEVSDDTDVAAPAGPAAGPADEGVEPPGPGEATDAGEPRDAPDSDDADGVDPAADQGAPPQADGGV